MTSKHIRCFALSSGRIVTINAFNETTMTERVDINDNLATVSHADGSAESCQIFSCLKALKKNIRTKDGPENIPKSKLPLITATIKIMSENATDIVYLTESRD